MEVVTYEPSSECLILNGEAAIENVTTFHDGESALQLKNVSESLWMGRSVKMIKITGMVVADGDDVSKLVKLIDTGLKLDFSDLYVMRSAENMTAIAFGGIDDGSVPEGSKIKVAFDVQTGLPTPLEIACLRVGFTIVN